MKRVARFSSAGVRQGFVGPALADPYTLVVAGDGVLYVVDTAASGRIRRIARDGTISTILTSAGS